MNFKASKKSNPRSRLTGDIQSPPSYGLLSSILRGLLASLIGCLALLLLTSFVVYTTADPNRYVIPASLTVLYTGCFLGGLVCSVSYKKAPLICGLAVSALFLLLLFCLSFFISPTLSAEHSLPLSIGLRGIAILISVLGALLGAKKKRRKNKKH